MTQTNEITNLEMENMDKKRELIKSMVQVAIKMQKELKNKKGFTLSMLITRWKKPKEESNFHSFNEKFENLWNKEMGGK